MDAVEHYLENCAQVKVDIELIQEEAAISSSSSIHQRSRATLWQAEDDGWRSQESDGAWQESGQNEWHDTEYQGAMAKVPPCFERTLKTPLPQQSSPSSREEEGRWVLMEDRRRRGIAFEKLAKEMLRYLDNSEKVNVSITELQERLEVPVQISISIQQVAQQARSENGQKVFEIFWQEEEELCIASWARWDAQWEGFVELERRCQDTSREMQMLSKRQDIF